jgi:hypothetical protein
VATVALVAMVSLTACGGSARVIEGRLAEVSGDLQTVESFVLLTDDGERLLFLADPAASFHGGPLSHIRDHLVSGEPVVVYYEERGDDLVATDVDDA